MSDAPVGVNSFPDQPREPIPGQKEAWMGPEAPAPSLLVSSLQSLEVVWAAQRSSGERGTRMGVFGREGWAVWNWETLLVHGDCILISYKAYFIEEIYIHVNQVELLNYRISTSSGLERTSRSSHPTLTHCQNLLLHLLQVLFSLYLNGSNNG